jgi:hypothetical protein
MDGPVYLLHRALHTLLSPHLSIPSPLGRCLRCWCWTKYNNTHHLATFTLSSSPAHLLTGSIARMYARSTKYGTYQYIPHGGRSVAFKKPTVFEHAWEVGGDTTNRPPMDQRRGLVQSAIRIPDLPLFPTRRCTLAVPSTPQ